MPYPAVLSNSEIDTNLKIKAFSKNVIPAQAGIHNILKSLDSRFRGSDKLEIIRGYLKSIRPVNLDNAA
jgi:hypothetical protein